MEESEELYLLRFRYGRAAEMFLAYKTFWSKQIFVGEKSYCKTEEHVSQVTHTLLLVFYSFIYSLFDTSATDFIKSTEQYKDVLTENGKKVRGELIDIWQNNKSAIIKIRNNIGFHGGVKLKSHEVGYGALIDLHPQIPELIMNQLAIFFIEIDQVIPPKENYKFHIDPEAKDFLFNRAEKLKEQVNDPMFMKMMQEMKKFL